MVKTFRVLVANKPKLMRELLLETLAEQSWIEIVGEVAEEADIPHHVQRDFSRPPGRYGRRAG